MACARLPPAAENTGHICRSHISQQRFSCNTQGIDSRQERFTDDAFLVFYDPNLNTFHAFDFAISAKTASVAAFTTSAILKVRGISCIMTR